MFQVQSIHAHGRPDIFKVGAKKYTDEELNAIIDDDKSPIYVFDHDGVIVGYAFCIYQETVETAQLYHRKVLYIDDLCVDSNYRKQGIGKQLYQYVLKVAYENDCDSVTLNVWSLNESALHFYQKMGMAPLKTMMEAPVY